MAAAAASDVKLLGSRVSPYVNRVQFALNLKCVDYEFIPENLADKSELLLKSNPVHKKIPVLIHGDKTICESLVIIQYIDELWSDAPSILPSDPYGRATARFWAAYIDDKLFPALWALSAAKDEESKATVIQKIAEGVTNLQGVLVKSNKNGKGFFGGEDLGLLDIVLGCFLGLLRITEINSNVKTLDETRTPALIEWAEKVTSHEAVKGTLPETEELLGIQRRMQEPKTPDASK